MKWEQVDSDRHVFSNDKFVFKLQKRSQGVYSGGRAFLLNVRKIDDVKGQYFGAFWISDDGYETYRKSSIDGKLWTDINEIKAKAEQILKQERFV